MLKWTLQQKKPETDYLPKRRHSAALKMPSRQSLGVTMENLFRRKSLGGNLPQNERNKENLEIFHRSPFGNALSPLQDLSNGQVRLRPSHSMRRSSLDASLSRRSTSRIESPRNTVDNICNNDGIREVARVTEKTNQINFPDEFVARRPHPRAMNKRHCKVFDFPYPHWLNKDGKENSPSSSRIDDSTLDKMLDAIIESAKKDERKKLNRSSCTEVMSDSIEDFYEPSIHEMEVKTPPNHHLKRQRVLRRKHKSEHQKEPVPPKMIGLTLPNGIPSPETPQLDSFEREHIDELANMSTPSTTFGVDVTSSTSKYPPSCSTPTVTEALFIRRCLNFSADSDEEFLDEKRKSVASSTASSGTFYREGTVRGSLDVAMFIENQKLNVHVIRCRDLQRPNGSAAVNAYVKVALLPVDSFSENGFQRTAVLRNSSRPYFDHRFKFDAKDEKVLSKRIQLAVWHRDREQKRSEFLGCMSVPVKTVYKTGINGSYKLQPQLCLTNPVPPISVTPFAAIPTSATATTIYNSSAEMAGTAGPRQNSSEEEVISIDSASAATSNVIETNVGQPITLSKKAIHQRDADENLFLRFLELDPPTDAAPSQRRMSTFKPALGRTPFTITKRLTRTAEKGFGFSIVWTHPPRVEKIEPGLSADKNGILPGDYVIFVDKHNVVTMPEADILNLIRSQGNTLTLEIFRRSSAAGVPALNASRSTVANGIPKSRVTSAASNYTMEEMSPAPKPPVGLAPRSFTACSNASMETSKRRLNLPQVTFSKESIAPNYGVEDHRRRFLQQLVNREQNFVGAINFGMQRFVTPLQERKDLISPHDHRTLFQNMDELQRISEDILEQLTQDDHEPHLNFASRVYLSKTTAICAAYRKYCNGIKRADCVLVNKSRQPGSEFVTFITEPQVPRKRPDLTMLIHRPLQHFREILKLMQLLLSHCHVDSEEHKNFTAVINELQAAYREITVGGGLMEPLGEGRPLLTLQDLEARMVFTRCKPFTLAVQGRQWIFGGDLSRVEGRSVKPYWTLLFSDIIVFAKVSRDRVLFITEEPLPIANIVDSYFNIRKKTSEFRITVDPNGKMAESPTGYCTPDLTRTPKKNSRRKTLVLRAPSLEMKAVWQNLLQRQIFLVNAALGSTPLSSPLDSPDVLNTLVPLSDIGATTTSMASMKLSSLDSINLKNQQQNRINASHQIEQLIDEKCRILNKTGTPKGSALHLANWMKGQLDKQQEQARLAAARSRETLSKTDDELTEDTEEEDEEDERITFWTREQLESRTKELNLTKENGSGGSHHRTGRRGPGGDEETEMSESESEVKTPSRSTTSDSQITVRSSPIANVVDRLSVCRHCHKNCKQKLSPSPPLISNSLKVQHSQASPNRCCQLSSMSSTCDPSRSSPTISNTSSTVTGDNTKSNSRPNSAPVSSVSPSLTRPLVNGNCSESESDRDTKSTTTATTSISSTTTTTTSSYRKIMKPCQRSQKNIPCNCKCTPEDFSNTTLSPDEVTQETCKIIEGVQKLQASPQKSQVENLHRNCKCVCKDKHPIKSDKDDRKDDRHLDDDMSLVLIGLAQFSPAAKLVNSDAFVPTISIVPPTPDSVLSKTTTNIWDNHTSTTTKLIISNTPKQAVIENIPEDSPDESPQDEEPPYRSLNTTLRRYGTMSSLEKLTDEVNDQEGSSEEGEGEEDEDNEDDDIEIITREVFNGDNNQTTLRNWTARAGSYVAGKISFFEESRAFIDKYLGRWNQEQGNELGEEEQMDECTSGATSGEEIWGTPTSGGDNDDMQIPNSENTSSPTKSSSSLNDDDDTELMMDELLMAPPMTASTIRGLLPRRRLEPLFEEETESEEEKTQQDSEDVKKGETASNGHDLEDSTGSSSDDLTEENQTQVDNVPKFIARTESTVTSVSVTMVKTIVSAPVPSIMRRAKFSPPPPPPRRLLLTQSGTQLKPGQGTGQEGSSGTADIGSSAAAQTAFGSATGRPIVAPHTQDSVKNTNPAENRQSAQTQTQDATVVLEDTSTIPSESQSQRVAAPGSGLSPRLEMRLALNNDIMGDEDLISYETGPDLTTILGHDLSTFHRLTGRDLLNRSANRIQPKEAVISYSQQRNSKMDTPTLNRKRQQQLQQNRNTWSSSVFADRTGGSDASLSSSLANSDRSRLSDLEILARREKMFCMSQLRSGSPARGTATTMRSTSSMGTGIDGISDSRKLDQNESTIYGSKTNSRTSRFFSFLTRRNSDNQLMKMFSRDSLNDSNSSSTPDRRMVSPRKDNDKLSLNRRFWKQLTKRRRAHSVSEIAAS